MLYTSRYTVWYSLIARPTYYVRLKADSQYDASLALRLLRCDKILKTDWSNAMQLTQK